MSSTVDSINPPAAQLVCVRSSFLVSVFPQRLNRWHVSGCLCLHRWNVYLENGVLVLVLRCVPCGVFPRDPEAHSLPVDPHQPRVSAAVHLRHQPRLQADTARGDWHPACWETAPTPKNSQHSVNTLGTSLLSDTKKCPFLKKNPTNLDFSKHSPRQVNTLSCAEASVSAALCVAVCVLHNRAFVIRELNQKPRSTSNKQRKRTLYLPTTHTCGGPGS